MRVIGLTGGIACGKSTVSVWLKDQPGCRIVDGDLLSRRLTAPRGPALPLIREAFGDRFFFSDGALNRRRLGSVIFSDDSARARLDSLMAPLMIQETQREISLARQDGATLCFLDYPLLFEKGYDRLCDTVWCVYLPRDLQLLRLMERDGLSEEEALERMDAVLSSEEKASRSQVVIDNSGSIPYTLSLLPALLAREYAAASAGATLEVPSTSSSTHRRRSRRYGEETTADLSYHSPDPSAHDAQSSKLSASLPETISRPPSSRRKPSERKMDWRLPSWLLVSLLISAALLLGGITAQSLMRAYLARQSEAHQSAANAVLREYPLEYRNLIESISVEYNLRPAFVTAIIRNESSFQPRAESNVGARG